MERHRRRRFRKLLQDIREEIVGLNGEREIEKAEENGTFSPTDDCKRNIQLQSDS
jgi:hypothetical protein